jgi:hypothetical protein
VDEQIGDLCLGKIEAEQLFDAREAQRDRGADLGDRALNVDDAACDLTSTDLLDQLSRAGDRVGKHRAVGAPLEALTGVCHKAMALRRPADGDGIEVSRLQRDGGGRLGDLAVETTHHTRQGHGAFAVGDHEIVLDQCELRAVERLEGLAIPRGPDGDLAVRDHLGVEGVEGMPQLHQHVVGHVDHVVDRAQARALERADHPQRARCDPDPLDQARAVARALAALLDRDVEHLLDVLQLLLDAGRGEVCLALVLGRQVARDAMDRHAVGPVGRDADVDEEVDGLTDVPLGRENQNARGVVVPVELLARAHHPLAGHTADLRRLEPHAVGELGADQRHGDAVALAVVGCPADDAQGSGLAHIDGAEGELVGVGVSLDALDLADEDFPRLMTQVDGVLDLEADVGQVREDLVERDVEADVLTQPTQ